MRDMWMDNEYNWHKTDSYFKTNEDAMNAMDDISKCRADQMNIDGTCKDYQTEVTNVTTADAIEAHYKSVLGNEFTKLFCMTDEFERFTEKARNAGTRLMSYNTVM